MFLKPNKSKVVTFFVITAVIVIGTVVLFAINERDLAGIFLYPLATLPITLFDIVTGSAFAPRECGFLCFPTIPQILFILVFDIVMIYLIVCGIIYAREKRTRTQTQNIRS